MKRKYFYEKFILFIVPLLLVSCSDGEKTVIANDPGNSNNTSNTNPTNQEEFYLSIKLTCINNNIINPVVCKVIVFDANTRKKIISGNTNSQGWYWNSGHAFDKDDRIKIEFWDFNNRCIDWLNYISAEKDPNWFVTDKNDVAKNKSTDDFHHHFGSCMTEFKEITFDIWGP